MILISGVTKGLGAALTSAFIERGHFVCGCGRSQDGIDELSRKYPAAGKFDVVDVSDDKQVASWAADLINKGHIPDLLINNAALINVPKPLWEVPHDEFESLLRVNVKGPYSLIRHFIPAMIKRGEGIIVNVSSGWGRSTSPEVAPYCATKWAIEGLTQSLAQELPAGLAAVAYNPGIIDTDMLRTCFGADAGHYPSPDEWLATHADALLSLSVKDNGRAI